MVTYVGSDFEKIRRLSIWSIPRLKKAGHRPIHTISTLPIISWTTERCECSRQVSNTGTFSLLCSKTWLLHTFCWALLVYQINIWLQGQRTISHLAALQRWESQTASLLINVNTFELYILYTVPQQNNTLLQSIKVQGLWDGRQFYCSFDVKGTTFMTSGDFITPKIM